MPPGSRLIGRVFDAPATSDPTVEQATDRWAALLLVDEEPRQALQALVADAQAAGFTVTDLSLDHCFRPDDGDGLVRPQLARCTFSLHGSGRRIDVDAAFGRCGGGPPASHISLGGRRSWPEAPPSTIMTGTSVVEPPPTTAASEDPQSGAPPSSVPAPSAPAVEPEPSTTVTTSTTTVTTSSTLPDDTPATSPVVEPEVPTSWARLPETGELLNARNPDGTGDTAPVALLDGTVAVAPAMVDCYLSHRSVLRVDGDPAEVVDAYVEEFAERSRDRTVVHRWDLGATRVTNVVADQAGGDKWYLTVTEEPGRPTWAFVETATDP